MMRGLGFRGLLCITFLRNRDPYLLTAGNKISIFDDPYICITRRMLIIQVEKILFWKLLVSERSKLGELRI